MQYFAKMLSKNDLPWKTATILVGLQELYKYGIITVEGDMLVQPRMFKDNGFELPDIDNDGDPVGTILDDPTSGSMALRGDDDFTQNNGANNGAEKRTDLGTEKVQKKDSVSHAPATRALSVENMSNNNIDKGNKGVQGGDAPNDNSCRKPCKNEKTDKDNPKRKNKDADSVSVSNAVNSTPDAQKTVSEPQNARKRPSVVADNPPTLEEIQGYMDERAQQGKPFVYVTAESFLDACEQSGWRLKDGKPMMDWRARMRTFENYRKEHGDRPVAQGMVQVQPKPGDPVGATPTAQGKYKNKW